MQPSSHSNSLTGRSFRVGEWTADTSANELTRDEQILRVEPKVMALLMELASRPGEVVSREALLKRVWPEVIVTEDALSRAVFKLRRALGDVPETPRYIETIPKSGYRLIAVVEPIDLRYLEGPTMRRRSRLLWGLGAGALGLGLIALVWLRFQGQDRGAPTARTLTHLQGIETHPALSPDGQRLAFVASDGEAMRDTDLWVMGVNDPAPQRLTRGPEEDLRPAWSPDGTTLAFLRCEELACGVYAIPAQGGQPRRMFAADVGPWGLDWESSGTLIAVTRQQPTAPFQVVRVDPESGAMQFLSDPPEDAIGDLFPRTSPDGLLLGFVRHGAEGDEDLWVVPQEGGTARQVTTQGVHIDGFAWEPGGRSVITAASFDGDPALWRVTLEGGVPARLPVGASHPRHPTISAGRLVFESRRTEVNLYTVDLRDGSGGVALTPAIVSTAADSQPALSPDGRQIAWVSDRSGSLELWRAQLGGGDPVRLTSFKDAHVGAPRWSPNGEWIVFEAQREGSAAIYRIAVDGGQVEVLTEGNSYNLGPRFSRDGQAIYFGSNRGGELHVWRMTMPDGTPEIVAEGYVGEEVPNEHALLVVRSGRPGLWKVLLSEGTPRLVDSLLMKVDWGSWVVTDEGVLFLERTGEMVRVVRLDLASGARTVVLDSLTRIQARYPALDVTRDGRTLVLARANRVESALVLMEPVE